MVLCASRCWPTSEISAVKAKDSASGMTRLPERTALKVFCRMPCAVAVVQIVIAEEEDSVCCSEAKGK
ncbi:hypothetical protein AOLI_G00109110 [Acnodon oligacanthus]